MIQSFVPTDLQSLFPAFERLGCGESVLLSSSAGRSAEPTGPPGPGSFLGVYSSGSTGQPKLCWQAWDQLRAAARGSERFRGWTWASPYAAMSFAGAMVALQAWVSGGEPISLPTHPGAAWPVLLERKPEALCCTPTFLELLLQQTPATPVWAPRQITLGGEPLRGSSGARFQRAFPNARFTVVYAAAEFGVMLKTSRLDGWYETGSMRCPGWRIIGGELEVEMGGAWRRTGDLVQQEGGLLRIAGRADAVANIAGTKVSLEAVARLAEEVPGVRLALAFSEASPITGQIVALRFMSEPGQNVGEVQGRLETHLRRHLRKEAWPRRFEAGAIALGANAKRASQ